MLKCLQVHKSKRSNECKGRGKTSLIAKKSQNQMKDDTFVNGLKERKEMLENLWGYWRWIGRLYYFKMFRKEFCWFSLCTNSVHAESIQNVCWYESTHLLHFRVRYWNKMFANRIWKEINYNVGKKNEGTS